MSPLMYTPGTVNPMWATSLFLASMLMGLVVPIVAVSYLRPILLKVLRGFCDADGGAEFWVRVAYLLAICGTLLLLLTWGQFESSVDMVQSMRRSLGLILAGVFVTVAFIARNVWSQVRRLTDGPAAPSAHESAAVASARVAATTATLST